MSSCRWTWISSSAIASIGGRKKASNVPMADESSNPTSPRSRSSEPLAIAHGADIMPRDYAISLAAKGGTDRLLREPGTHGQQPMRGFEATYVDIVDYIVRITHRIWEEKDIGYIYDTYRHNAHVYDDFGLQYGRDKIVADTVHTINAFPDIRLFADEIIWAGDEDIGFHSSHRTVISGHNSGYSQYGAPTGRKVTLWCIANCVSLENEIFAEWVVYDTASLVHQLGFDLREMARELGNRQAAALDVSRSGEPERLHGQGKPRYLAAPASGFDVEEFVRRSFHNIWNRRCLREARCAYAPSLLFRGSTGRVLYGRGDYQAFVLSMLAMFPDAMLQIDDIYWMGNDEEGYKVSARWSLQGTHRGNGIYGAPSGRQVTMWGITQQEIQQGRVQKEWMLFNEFAVMQQIYRD
ncbi:MAG: ester cyclase [Chloroflexi bacterium]|nr:ester cyclase [Chloroflexota bacterium]